MKVSEFVQEVRDQIRDPNNVFVANDVQVRRLGNRHVRAMHRAQVEAEGGYHNFPITIAQADAVQKNIQRFHYYLPPFVSKVHLVRESKGSTEGPGAIVEAVNHREEYIRGWRFSGPNTIELFGFSQAIDLEIDASKFPSKATTGTVNQPHPDDDKLWVTYSESNDELETTTNAYVNAEFHMTGISTTSHLVAGQVRRCISSSLKNDSGTMRIELQFEQSWGVTPIANDTWEMGLEIPDEHTRLVVLLTARSIYQQEGNNDSLRAIRSELDEERLRFRQYIQPRQQQEAVFMRGRSTRETGRRSTMDNEHPAIFSRYL